MVFIDSIDIYASSGKGGNGCISFLTYSKSSKKPDGGNGGVGGNVYFLGDSKLTDFSLLKFNLNYKAFDGENGRSKIRTGKNGKDLYIKVPIGTIIYDIQHSFCFGEILNDGDKIMVLSGGKAGYGNYFLRSCEDRILNKMILGGDSKLLYFHLELKLLSDVGLLGFPNVGKSKFINVVSNSLSKSDYYSFTTLIPFLGVLKFDFFKNIIISDLPGIIHNSHLGKGLGFDFLKHLLKSKLLLHFIDVNSHMSYDSVFSEISLINNELKLYNEKLFFLKKWLVFNKIDLRTKLDFFLYKKDIISEFNYDNIFFISSKEGYGLKKLCYNINEFFILY